MNFEPSLMVQSERKVYNDVCAFGDGTQIKVSHQTRPKSKIDWLHVHLFWYILPMDNSFCGIAC